MSHFRCDITPITTPENPHILSIGETLTIELSIENQSSEVKRLHLVGSQLPENCYTIHYPDVQVWTGLVVKFNSLELEPGQVGRIEVQIHPPQGAPTQRQQLTLSLHSDQSSDATGLQHTVYLQVEPAHDLLVTLEPKSQATREEVGYYQVLIKNNGSVHRHLTAQVRSLNRKSHAVYALEPSFISLPPEAEVDVALEVRPKKQTRFRWARPRREKFELGLEDHDGLPLPGKLPCGSLTWQLQRSPRWLLLPLVLGAAATAASVWAILGRQSRVPKISSLQVIAAPEATQEEAVRLNWTVENPKQLQKLVLMRQDSTGQQQLQTLDFSQGIPEEFRQENAAWGFCQLNSESRPKTLTCKNILAPVTNTQLHRFQLQSFGRSVTEPADSKLTEAVAIQPSPVPKIVAFFSPNTIYTSRQKSAGVLVAKASNQGKTQNSNTSILLNWEIANAQRIKELQLRSSNGQLQTYDLQSGKLPPALARYCSFEEMLVCKQVPTQTQQPGDYVFKLTALPKGRLAKATAPRFTGPIKVNPQPLRIASFRINGQDVTDKYIYDVAKLGPQAKLELDWRLEGGNEVRAAIFPAPGAVPTAGKTTVQLNPLFQEGNLFLQAVDANGQQIKQSVAIEFQNLPSTAKNLPASPKSTPQAVAARPPQPPPVPAPIHPSSPKVSASKPVPKPVTQPAPVRQTPVVAAAPSPRPSGELLTEANAIIRGLVLARNDGKIAVNGATWRKTQDAVRLLRQGYSRPEAARRSGVPLWKLDTLVAIGNQ